MGPAPVAPGDLLCSGRRPAYTRLAERRTQMGEGARTHCDIVVKVDLEQALLRVKNQEQQIYTDLKIAVRDVETNFKRINALKRYYYLTLFSKE